MEKLVTVVGTTASGKSDLGIILAREFNGEIISCDSRQVYKGLDLGTGKVTKEEQLLAPHHLIDIINPNEKFSLAQFQKLAYKAINDILERGKQPFLVGGTGLYSRSIVEGYNFSVEQDDEELRNKINALSKDELKEKLKEYNISCDGDLSPRHLARRLEKAIKGTEEEENKRRYDVLQLVMMPQRNVLYQRIQERLDKRLEKGMIEEVKSLKEQGATNEFLEGLGLEYRYINRYINGEYTFDEFYEKLFMEIRHFAKRQCTWFKKEKNAVFLNMDGNFERQAKELVKEFLNL